MSKIVIANHNNIEESLGGQETFFSILSKIFNAKRVSYTIAENVLKHNLFSDVFRIVYRGYVIDKYLVRYENLFKPNLIIKNSGVGGFVKLRTPQIVVFQDPFYNIIEKSIENGIFFNLEHYSTCIELQRKTAQNAKTVAVSNFMKKDMELCGIKCDKVIEEGIDIEKFKPNENKIELRKKYGIPLDKKVGIAVTKFIPPKGWDILAKLINKFPDIHWIVVLTSEVGIKPKLKNVTLLERVVPKLMPELYNASDFYISTSSVESFGLSSVESSACGLPVITYRTGWAWDWWDKRLGLRVDTWDVYSFTKAVNDLFAEGHIKYEPRKAIIEKGFTLERMKKDWKEFVEKTLNKQTS